MGGDFTARNADLALGVRTWYSDLWTGLEVRGAHLLIFPHLLTMWTLILTFRALVGDVVLEISSQNICDLVIALTFVRTRYEEIVTRLEVCLQIT